MQGICKAQGMISMKRGRLGNALTWALQSQDGPFTSFLADKFLQEYIKSGKLVNTDFLDNLGSCMLASDRLIFLGNVFLYSYSLNCFYTTWEMTANVVSIACSLPVLTMS